MTTSERTLSLAITTNAFIERVAIALNTIDYILVAYDPLYAPLLTTASSTHLEIRTRIRSKFLVDLTQSNLHMYLFMLIKGIVSIRIKLGRRILSNKN